MDYLFKTLENKAIVKILNNNVTNKKTENTEMIPKNK